MFGDKWTMVVLRDLLIARKSYFQEFLDSDEGIATNILSDRLAKLEQNGLIDKTQDPSKKSRNIYTPTHKSRDLLPVFIEMSKWSAVYDSDSPIAGMAARNDYDDVDSFIEDSLRKAVNSHR
ncbi:MAG: DNA-binding HxlR family transcriptional regulator [Candidatus Saccharimonadales bacterium]|jgi:DNA-binding HxlR family transcriptional regulator